jgi:hypothetical protein
VEWENETVPYCEPGGRSAKRATALMLVNFILFQIGWFACVLGGARGLPMLGTGVALAIVAFHVARAARPGDEAILVLISAAIGLFFDSALVAAGWVRYPAGTLVPGVAPYWIVALWMLFATTLNVSLRWLRRMPVAAALLGAVGGPVAYWGGARLGGMQFAEPVAASIALAAGWAVITPILVRLARHFDGYPAAPTANAAPASPRAFRSPR